jgi:hypothetical protein
MKLKYLRKSVLFVSVWVVNQKELQGIFKRAFEKDSVPMLLMWLRDQYETHPVVAISSSGPITTTFISDLTAKTFL